MEDTAVGSLLYVKYGLGLGVLRSQKSATFELCDLHYSTSSLFLCKAEGITKIFLRQWFLSLSGGCLFSLQGISGNVCRHF